MFTNIHKRSTSYSIIKKDFIPNKNSSNIASKKLIELNSTKNKNSAHKEFPITEKSHIDNNILFKQDHRININTNTNLYSEKYNISNNGYNNKNLFFSSVNKENDHNNDKNRLFNKLNFLVTNKNNLTSNNNNNNELSSYAFNNNSNTSKNSNNTNKFGLLNNDKCGMSDENIKDFRDIHMSENKNINELENFQISSSNSAEHNRAQELRLTAELATDEKVPFDNKIKKGLNKNYFEDIMQKIKNFKILRAKEIEHFLNTNETKTNIDELIEENKIENFIYIDPSICNIQEVNRINFLANEQANRVDINHADKLNKESGGMTMKISNSLNTNFSINDSKLFKYLHKIKINNGNLNKEKDKEKAQENNKDIDKNPSIAKQLSKEEKIKDIISNILELNKLSSSKHDLNYDIFQSFITINDNLKNIPSEYLIN